MKRMLLSLALTAVSASAASPLQEAKLRFAHCATRAVANFRVADSIEARLGDQGMTLHSSLVALRLRIESTLDQAEAALGKGDITAVNETLELAEALTSRFARRVGGE